MKSNYDELNGPGWLREKYEYGMDTTEIARDLGCQPSTVTSWTIHHGLYEYVKPQAKLEKNDLSKEWLQDKVDEYGSLDAVANNTGWSRGTLGRWAIRYRIDVPEDDEDDNSISGLPDEWPSYAKTGQPWQDEAQLRRAYHEYLWSPADIASICDVNEGVVRYEMERKGMEMRDTAEGMRIGQMREKGLSLEQRRAALRRMRDDEPDEDDGYDVEWSKLAAGD
jgi:hypothetical protein